MSKIGKWRAMTWLEKRIMRGRPELTHAYEVRGHRLPIVFAKEPKRSNRNKVKSQPRELLKVHNWTKDKRTVDLDEKNSKKKKKKDYKPFQASIEEIKKGLQAQKSLRSKSC